MYSRLPSVGAFLQRFVERDIIKLLNKVTTSPLLGQNIYSEIINIRWGLIFVDFVGTIWPRIHMFNEILILRL